MGQKLLDSHFGFCGRVDFVTDHSLVSVDLVVISTLNIQTMLGLVDFGLFTEVRLYSLFEQQNVPQESATSSYRLCAISEKVDRMEVVCFQVLQTEPLVPAHWKHVNADLTA